jgi:hypothetical protein
MGSEKAFWRFWLHGFPASASPLIATPDLCRSASLQGNAANGAIESALCCWTQFIFGQIRKASQGKRKKGEKEGGRRDSCKDKKNYSGKTRL